MANKTFEEQCKEYDERKDIHYYVYFSSWKYQYCVDVIEFKRKSDIKNEYYKKLKYYSKYNNAKQVADKLNATDTNVGHLFGRAAYEFANKLNNILSMEGMNGAQKCAVEAAKDNIQALTKLLNNENS